MSMDLAAEAMAVLVPFLTGAGEGAAKLVGEKTFASAGKLVNWVRAHLPGQGTALAALEAKPYSAARREALRAELALLLEDDPGLVPELRALLPAARADVVALNQTVDRGIGVQTVGQGNTFTIHRG